MIVSVIIPAYNQNEVLELTLIGLSQQDFHGKFEVIIIDDGSSVPLKKPLKNNRFDCKIIYYGTNKGRSYARNTGIENAIGDILLFCDEIEFPIKTG